MNGCLRGAARLGCLGALVLAAALAWWFREPILRTVAGWFGPREVTLPPTSDIAVGAPTPGALESGRAKLLELARSGGPDSVILTPNEMASLVGSGIDWSVRRAFDSLRVELLEGEIAVHTRLDTRRIPPEALGPFSGMLEEREPFRIAGPIRIESPGRARWEIRELSIRGIEFPAPAVKQIARRVAGADGSGAVPVRVDRVIGGVAVHPTGVVLYRRTGA
ncbi:MAG TPA: hypothetical protein VNI61_09155 [Gemmatimonadales bacterium]|nr:hypothetical protein [Gemmatimonadales bacterium]